MGADRGNRWESAGMSRLMRASILFAAAALPAGCATGGSGDRLGPAVTAPAMDQAPARETATVSPAPLTSDSASDTKTASASSGTLPPAAANAGKTKTVPGYEYRMYHFLSVNAKGQKELGPLVARLSPEGWELHEVRIVPAGYNTAIFRRHQRLPVTPKPGLPQTPAAANTTPGSTGAAKPAGGTGETGTPSSLPPPPGR
jgi:hypothetical protein